MKRILVWLLCSGTFVPAGLLAQEVYNDTNRAVLDLRTSTGMPAGAVTSVSKTAIYTAAGYTPHPTGWDPDNLTDATLNATVYERLEVAPYDLDNSGAITNGGIGYYDWVDAFNYCRSATYNGNGWRLPTQREMILMLVFKDALEDIFTTLTPTGTAFQVWNYYWSATESDASAAWIVNLGNGYTVSLGKSTTSYVRCVREL